MTPSSLASRTRAASSCAPDRRALGGWCRRCPDWRLPTAWPRRSTFRCRTEARRATIGSYEGSIIGPWLALIHLQHHAAEHVVALETAVGLGRPGEGVAGGDRHPRPGPGER